MPSGETGLFVGELPLVFSVGDTVEYWIVARDLSESKNTTISSLQRFIIGYENFENGLANWLVDPESWGVAAIGYKSIHSVCSSPKGFYPLNQDVALTNKYGIDLSHTDKALLTFWTAYFMEENKDFGFIEISIDSAATWQQLGDSYTGTCSDWQADSVSLSDYTGAGYQDVLLRFRFMSDSTESEILNGWYIDDIKIIPDIDLMTSVPVGKNIKLKSFWLKQNYPNPFNPETAISYQLPALSHVKLVIYDIQGREVRTLVSKRQQAGEHQISWDGIDKFGLSVSAGIYFCRIEANYSKSNQKQKFVKVIKLALVK
jgi:hypothetical protein